MAFIDSLPIPVVFLALAIAMLIAFEQPIIDLGQQIGPPSS